MSPTFLRAVYQICGTSCGGEESLSWKMISVSPGLE